MNEGNFLFNSDKNHLPGLFEDLTEDDIASCCDYKIFLRGVEYYNRNLVKNAEYFPEAKMLRSIVKGGEKYTVEIFEKNNEILGSCTCPCEDVCKHIIAVLMFASENDFEESINESNNKKDENSDKWVQYLSTLDKNQLIDLIDKYAPTSFKNEIINRNSERSVALKTFLSVRKKIEEIFNDEGLLYYPSEFETTLTETIKKLKGFEIQLPKEIGDLIIYIIENVDTAFGEGYLYVDNYSYEDIFQSEYFCEFVCEFTRKLPFIQKIEFLAHLDEVLNNMSHNTFEDIEENFCNIISKPELNDLKLLITTGIEKYSASFISRLYDSIITLLNDSDKEIILGKLKMYNPIYLTEFCELLISQNRKNKAYDELNEYVTSDRVIRNEKLFSLFLELSNEMNKNISEVSLMVISKCPTSEMLVKIKSLSGKDIYGCKGILEKKNPEELLFFLEKEQMFDEAISLIQKGIMPEYVDFDFFKRNKKLFATDAEKCFTNRINKNLQFTGDSYYALIAESLEHLYKINPGAATRIINDIRLNYKRRKKLISMLNHY